MKNPYDTAYILVARQWSRQPFKDKTLSCFLQQAWPAQRVSIIFTKSFNCSMPYSAFDTVCKTAMEPMTIQNVAFLQVLAPFLNDPAVTSGKPHPAVNQIRGTMKLTTFHDWATDKASTSLLRRGSARAHLAAFGGEFITQQFLASNPRRTSLAWEGGEVSYSRASLPCPRPCRSRPEAWTTDTTTRQFGELT